MTDNNIALSNVATTMGADIKAFRTAAVSSENKATPMARSILAGLVSGLATVNVVESAAIHSFGNPKSPKTGKVVTKLSGLRDFVGGDATRKALTSIFEVFANIDADKESASAIRPAVVAFILDEKDAAKSLKALGDTVKAMVNAHVAATQPDNSDAVEENKTDDEIKGNASDAAATSLKDRVAEMIVALDNADTHGLLALDDSLASLQNAIAAAYDRLLAAQDPEAIAA